MRRPEGRLTKCWVVNLCGGGLAFREAWLAACGAGFRLDYLLSIARAGIGKCERRLERRQFLTGDDEVYLHLVQRTVDRRAREVTAMLNRWKGKEMKYSLPAWLRD